MGLQAKEDTSSQIRTSQYTVERQWGKLLAWKILQPVSKEVARFILPVVGGNTSKGYRQLKNDLIPGKGLIKR